MQAIIHSPTKRKVIECNCKGKAIAAAHRLGLAPCTIELFGPASYAKPREVIFVPKPWKE